MGKNHFSNSSPYFRISVYSDAGPLFLMSSCVAKRLPYSLVEVSMPNQITDVVPDTFLRPLSSSYLSPQSISTARQFPVSTPLSLRSPLFPYDDAYIGHLIHRIRPKDVSFLNIDAFSADAMSPAEEAAAAIAVYGIKDPSTLRNGRVIFG